MRNEKGFSLVELIVTMAVFVFVLAAGSQIFTAMITQFKQQSKIGETDIEGAVGLDIMRRDLAHAGYALPWNVTQQPGCATCCTTWNCLSGYYEAASVSNPVTADPASFNDGTTSGTGGLAPRAIVSGRNLFNNPLGSPDNGQSYLVIKGANMATNYCAGRSTNLRMISSTATLTSWTPAKENVNVKPDGTSPDPVMSVVFDLGTALLPRQLVLDVNAKWCTTYNASGAALTTCSNAGATNFVSSDSNETRIVYGIDPTTDLRMPFNRADYYVRRPASDIPVRCAPNTGVLYKATVNQGDGGLSEMPLLDCVAYMHVDYVLNTSPVTIVDGLLSSYTAENIRNLLLEIRVYIIAQEGQRDASYDFSNGGTRTNFQVTDSFQSVSRILYLPYDTSAGTAGSLSTLISPDGSQPDEYKHYRWKLYTLVVRPNSLN